jgi:hypothetical protein
MFFMVIIETKNWDNFEGSDLRHAKDEFINVVAPTASEDFSIENVLYEEDYLSDYLVKKIEVDLESEIQKWRTLAEIESSGLSRAQQESMEG